MPPIVVMLSKLAVVDEYDLSSLKVLFIGAAPIGAQVLDKVAERCGCRVMQGYGEYTERL